MFALMHSDQHFLSNLHFKDDADPEFEILLDYLKYNRSCDLTIYKRPSLMRRFRHRMNRINIDSYRSYLQYLQCHPQEHFALLNDVLINFTDFFRDPNAWSYVMTQVIPKIMAHKPLDEPIRVWSAGCSTGQEIYSLLILLAEVLGVEFCLQRVQCYATDIDAEALQQAQSATYKNAEMGSIPLALLQKYFEPTSTGYVFHSGLHNTVTFKPHHLLQDAPLSDIDLLVCRNVLMYFTPETQERILNHFHQALKNTGFLFIGRVEILMNSKTAFTIANLKQRVYRKKERTEIADTLFLPASSHPLPTPTLSSRD